MSDISGNYAAVAAETDSAASVGDFVQLLKPRVMSLVVFTGLVGMAVAPGALHPLLAAVAILCIGVGAGAAGAINMWYDRDVDLVMRRTRGRPIPSGRVAPEEALAFGVTLAFGSILVLALAVNYAAASLLALTIGFYVFVYTAWLKRRTPQNIVIGGAAGALPPVIGWAAVTGDVGVFPILLFLIIFFWTPPHFWALALYRADDYGRAGVPMLPNVSGAAETRRQMLLYTLVLVPVTAAPWALGMLGPVYGVAAVALGLAFVRSALAVRRAASDASARRMFGFSILYLFLVFTMVLVDRWATALGWVPADWTPAAWLGLGLG